MSWMHRAGHSDEIRKSWWRHQMEAFSALLGLCAGISPVTGEFPSQRPVTRSFDFFFDLRLNKRLSKQSWGWCFETPSRPVWRHCNVVIHDANFVVTAWTWWHHRLSLRQSTLSPMATKLASCQFSVRRIVMATVDDCFVANFIRSLSKQSIGGWK